MATKTLTVTEEAYNRLAALKKENESFSMVINRISHKKTDLEKLRALHGIISEENAEALEKSIIKMRTVHRELHKKRLERLSKEFDK